jgi:hypothetical protein
MAVAACLLLAFHSSGSAESKARAPICTVALYGDSILHGAYVAFENGKAVPGRWERFPAAEIKARRPAYTIQDKTESAQSLSVMRAKFNTDRLPRIVVLGSGIAEGWYGGPIAEPLRSLVELIRAKGSIPIITGYARQLPNKFMTAQKFEGRDRADLEARTLAAQMNVQFADFGAAGPVEIVDQVHPTQAYSLRLTQQLLVALDKVAPECGEDDEASANSAISKQKG